jgi:uncharacterized protein (DUF1697 family)
VSPPARIALLRAVNLGNHKKLAMPPLAAMAADLGLEQPRTLLQSGNLVFRSAAPPSELEDLLERETASRLGVATDYMIRTPEEWDAAIAGNPFARAAVEEPSRLLLHCFKQTPAPEAVAAVLKHAEGCRSSSTSTAARPTSSSPRARGPRSCG